MTESKPVRVVQFGLGPIGQECVRVVAGATRFELAGAIDIDPEKVGKDVGMVAGLGKELGVTVRSDAAAVLRETAPDVVLHTTQSFVPMVFDQLVTCIDAGANVVSSTEELFWPWRRHPDLARRLDEKAKAAGVTVLGTGVNPGFVMDTLPIVLSSQCVEVKRVVARRVVDASKRRLPLQKKVGAGMTPEEFRERVEQGKLGHIGLVESLVAIAESLGWKLDKLDERIEPVVSQREVRTPYLTVAPGQVAGIKHTCAGVVDGREALFLDLRMYVGAEEPLDEVLIEGVPPVHVVVKGGIFGDTATVANLVNAIPRVLAAEPGLKTVPELTLPRFTL